MNRESVVAVYDSVEQARLAVHILNRSDIANEQVSLIASHLEGHRDIESRLLEGADDVHDALVGAGIGSLIGVLTGFSIALVGGTVAIVAGPLTGLVTGAVAGTFLGGMEGWGIHRHRVSHYERLVQDGHPLVVVTGDPLQIAQAYRVLQQTDARELHVYATSADDATPAAAR